VIALEARGGAEGGRFVLKLSDNERVSARAVVIASGARYRQLAVDGLEGFEAASVHYWASPLEGKLCAGQAVALVGAGNSAGQAAVYLASQAAKVWLLVRGRGLASSMSRYLVDRIAGLSNVEVLTQTVITGLEGRDGMLERPLGLGQACRRGSGRRRPGGGDAASRIGRYGARAGCGRWVGFV